MSYSSNKLKSLLIITLQCNIFIEKKDNKCILIFYYLLIKCTIIHKKNAFLVRLHNK